MKEKEIKELENFAKKNYYNHELKDIHLRKVLGQTNIYD